MAADFRKLSFRKKILSSYIIFIGISCLLFVIYAGKSMENAREESFRYMHQLGEQINLNTDIIISNLDRIRFIHFIDTDVQPIIRTSNELKEYKAYLEDINYMQKVMSHMTNMNQYILRAVIVNEYGDVYTNVYTDQKEYLKGLEEFTSSKDWSDKLFTAYTGVYESRINMVAYHIVTCVSRLYGIDGDNSIGTLYIDLNFDAIGKMLDQTFQRREDASYFLILDQNKDLIYTSPYTDHGFFENLKKEEREGAIELLKDDGVLNGRIPAYITLDEKLCIATAVENDTTGWTVLVYEPLSQVYSKGLKNMLGVLAGMGFLLILALVLGFVISGQISRPVTILARAMKKADKGNVELICEDYYWKDEMGQLLHSYNEMGKRINESIEKIYVYQLNQKQTELKMLQFQINPHFLYNTLNTISSIAALEEIDEIAEISDSLSSMFQYNIKGRDIVPVCEELRHVKNYLNIQSIRFPGRYEFTFDVAEELLNEPMLKLLIQPLVENSLHHAFCVLKEINRIKLTVKEEKKGEIGIYIWDNGVGMGKETIDRLNQELLQTDTKTLVSNVDKGIGLRNVNARIKNYYGFGYGITITGREGEYTQIQLRIKQIGGRGDA